MKRTRVELPPLLTESGVNGFSKKKIRRRYKSTPPGRFGSSFPRRKNRPLLQPINLMRKTPGSAKKSKFSKSRNWTNCMREGEFPNFRNRGMFGGTVKKPPRKKKRKTGGNPVRRGGYPRYLSRRSNMLSKSSPNSLNENEWKPSKKRKPRKPGPVLRHHVKKRKKKNCGNPGTRTSNGGSKKGKKRGRKSPEEVIKVKPSPDFNVDLEKRAIKRMDEYKHLKVCDTFYSKNKWEVEELLAEIEFRRAPKYPSYDLRKSMRKFFRQHLERDSSDLYSFPFGMKSK